MKSGMPLGAISAELRRQVESKRDLKAPSNLLKFSASPVSEITIDLPRGEEKYGTTELARKQLAEKLGIPLAYFQRMESQQRTLLEQNVNTWLQTTEEERLVRILDGNVRAILSSRYRRLDNVDLCEAILPLLCKLPSASFPSTCLTEKKLYLKVISEATTYEIAPADVIKAGVAVSNSEVGCGSLSVQPLVVRSKAGSGFIIPDKGFAKKHVGRLLDAEDEGFTVFKDDTLEAEDRAFYKKVRDVVDHCVSKAQLAVVGEKIQRSLGIPIIGSVKKVVEVLAQKYVLSDREGDSILEALARGGDLSAFGLASAIATMSAGVEDYDRATELEAIAGSLMTAPAGELVDLVAAE